MGVIVLVLGESGSGKSTSLRNFNEGEIGIFNIAGKPLPFRNNLAKLDRARYNQIHQSLGANKMRSYIIDDAGYLLSFDNFSKAKQTGFQKFVDMAMSFEQLLEAAINTSDDTIVYFMMHIERNDVGRVKPKLIGKMLDEKLCVEGLFSIVLMCENDESGHHFITKSDGLTPVKTPMGMFDDTIIDNDLKFVDTTIREFYNMKPLVDSEE